MRNTKDLLDAIWKSVLKYKDVTGHNPNMIVVTKDVYNEIYPKGNEKEYLLMGCKVIENTSFSLNEQEYLLGRFI